jgi:hypothetical protein
MVGQSGSEFCMRIRTLIRNPWNVLIDRDEALGIPACREVL